MITVAVPMKKTEPCLEFSKEARERIGSSKVLMIFFFSGRIDAVVVAVIAADGGGGEDEDDEEKLLIFDRVWVLLLFLIINN